MIDEAGIPVWAGARVWWPNSATLNKRQYGYVVGLVGDRPLIAWIMADGVTVDSTPSPQEPGDVLPDLDDPDTQAGFVRRIALRMGAPPEDLEEGAIFYWSHLAEEHQIVTANTRWWHALRGLPVDRRLALIRAWQKIGE